LNLQMTKLGYVLFLMLLSSPVMVPLTFWADRLSRAGRVELATAIGFYVLEGLWIFLVGLVAHQAAIARVEMKKKYFESLSWAFSELRVYASLLPVVGRFFQKERKGDPPPMP
jgi:hypothetical protein